MKNNFYKLLICSAFTVGLTMTSSQVWAGTIVDSLGGAGTIDVGTVSNADLANNSVSSAKIVDGTVTAADLANGSVNSAKILDGTIATADLADSSVNSAKILDGTVATADLADSSVNSAKILDDSITAADIATGGVTSTEILDGTIQMADLDAGLQKSIYMVSRHEKRLNELEAGVAMAFAMASAPVLPNKKFNFSLGAGTYEGTHAVSSKISYAVT